MADKQENSSTSQKLSSSFLGELMQQIKLVYYLIRDRDVPIYLKVLPFLGVLYVLFPIDIITDVIPVLGQIDDLMILTIGAKVFIELAPAHVVAKYIDQMRGQTIVEGTATDVEMPIKLIEADVVGVEADAEPQADLVKKNGKRH
ncbi:MAG: DUF1232 domain-containing protein [Candidatus Promineofilum sp.]|nr:DUF1232 domain-containing protein [Promineifilum sp.]